MRDQVQVVLKAVPGPLHCLSIGAIHAVARHLKVSMDVAVSEGRKEIPQFNSSYIEVILEGFRL